MLFWTARGKKKTPWVSLFGRWVFDVIPTLMMQIPTCKPVLWLILNDALWGFTCCTSRIISFYPESARLKGEMMYLMKKTASVIEIQWCSLRSEMRLKLKGYIGDHLSLRKLINIQPEVVRMLCIVDLTEAWQQRHMRLKITFVCFCQRVRDCVCLSVCLSETHQQWVREVWQWTNQESGQWASKQQHSTTHQHYQRVVHYHLRVTAE